MVYGNISSFIHLLSSYFSGNRHEPAMTADEFRKNGKAMIDYIADYMENIGSRRVVPNIEPGYLKDCLPDSAPLKPESYEKIISDVEQYIMPGITHWQHPRFHAYFPAGNSYPSILADMLSDAIGCVGFSWAASPACTELETIILHWLGKMVGLPSDFLPFGENSNGGGVIQTLFEVQLLPIKKGSASECILVSLLAARFATMKELKNKYPFVEEGILLSKLIAYCSKEAHSSVEKACMIGLVKLRILETDEYYRLRGETVRNAIELQEDKCVGLIPFFVSTTLGTTSCCSFDALSEIGPVCTQESVWLHVDAAYAGSAFICSEFKILLRGIEHAMSFNLNPNKFMLVNFDCSTMWVKDRFKLTQALVVDPLYLQHSYSDKSIDYRHWGIPLSRRFRSLKLWFVIRMYGVEGLQRYVRQHVRLAKKFEHLVKADDRFEVVNEVILGLVCFRLKGSSELNRRLLTKLNASGKIHMVPASLSEKFIIRFCVCAERATDDDIEQAWLIIKQIATQILEADFRKQSSIDKSQGTSNALPTAAAAAKNPAIPRSLALDNEEAEAEENDEDEDEETEESKDTLAEEAVAQASLEARRKHSLAHKRSFFVKMVSDPKLYNPKIVRSLSTSRRRLSDDLKRDMSLRADLLTGLAMSMVRQDVGVQTPD